MSEIARIKLGAIIDGLCDQAGCDTRLRKKHYKQFMGRWNPHPPQTFVVWWTPYDRDFASGAHIGGHPDSRRIWSRKDADGYTHRWYGLTAESAYNCAYYKDEWETWVLAGCPEKPKPFMSLAATLERQQEFLKHTLRHIGKPMPR